MNSFKIKRPYSSITSEFFAASFDELGKVPDKPGIYMWMFNPRDIDEINAYQDLIFRNELDVSVKGNLRFSYQGQIRKEKSPRNELIHTQGKEELKKIIEELGRNALLANSQPLYIGMSMCLSSRIQKHKDQFTASLSNLKSNTIAFSGINSGVENDSDFESNYFGSRLASTWVESEFRDTSSLYVKFATIESNLLSKIKTEEIRSSLLDIERLLNNIYNPVFGRR